MVPSDIKEYVTLKHDLISVEYRKEVIDAAKGQSACSQLTQ